MTNDLLAVRSLSKRFGGVTALRQVEFRARAGEVHALLGENGAGKSTLIKVLAGVHRADGGEIAFDGKPIPPQSLRSPAAAEALGISTVFQEINLIPHMTVAENIGLGRESTRWGLIRRGALAERAVRALDRLELRIDVRREVAGYSIAIQQLVAIARALDVRSRLLILDEPTSSLDRFETERLLHLLRRLRGEGLGIIFVTHFLDQVYAVSDRITVLRDGQRVGEFVAAELPRLELVSHMIGRPASAPQRRPFTAQFTERREEPLVSARGIGRRNAATPMDLEIRAGEIVGLAGLLGSGRSELARLLFGADRADCGTVHVLGVAQRLRSPRDAIALGIAMTPEDRKRAGLFAGLSVRENLLIALQARRGFLGPLRRAAAGALVTRLLAALNVKTPGADEPIGRLSGGNQQKVLLARWLAIEPKLLILDEPTRGIDVGARAEIERLIEDFRSRGMAVLLISAELDELVRVCDRVIVLRDRRKVAELHGNMSEQQIMERIAEHAG